MSKIRVVGALALLVLLFAACSDSDEEADPAETSEAPAATDGDGAADDGAGDDGAADEGVLDDDLEDQLDDTVDSLEDLQDAEGGGGATLTVGDQTWTFDSVLCARGEEEIGQEGAELVLTGLQDGLQLYVSIDSFGHSVSINDVEDFENPSVALSADPFTAQLNGGPEEFISVDGDRVTASATFMDENASSAAPVPGELDATCP